MKMVVDILEERISAAMRTVTANEECAAIVRPANNPKFGDYQANGVMALAKETRTNPRKLAEKVLANLEMGDICEQPEVARPGFINLRPPTLLAPGSVRSARRLVCHLSSDAVPVWTTAGY